jgi:hypothetical protein
MHRKTSEKDADSLPARSEQDTMLTEAEERRLHKRFACAVTVSVEIPFVPTLGFAARDFSRAGMRLNFRDREQARRAFGDNLVRSGCGLNIQCAISLNGTRHECTVPAKIVRMDKSGIAVRFGDHSPWQLMALVDLFARSEAG